MSRADSVNRTSKLFADDGTAASIEEAEAIHAGYVLQVVAGHGIGTSMTRQAMLATAINTGSRAFGGGVRVLVDEETTLELPWARSMTITETAERYGGTVSDELSADYPTIVVGMIETVPLGSTVIYPTWDGWSGGVVIDPATRLAEKQEFVLAGVLCAGLSISEAFQHRYGYPPAGRRSVGNSLWRPDIDWRGADAVGPPCRFLPSSAWLLGLGHLGQAYAWALGCLPYPDPNGVIAMLQDFDIVVDANRSTGALSAGPSVGNRKTRVVAERLEALEMKTAITERAFDAHTTRVGDEPVLALAGFDHAEPRRALDPHARGFQLAVDAGLGRGVDHYLDILVHSFPSSVAPAEAFPLASADAGIDVVDKPAYRELISELVAQGEEEGDAECGTIEIAGRTVAAAFVGAVASALVLAEPLRLLNGGQRYEVVDISLRSPQHIAVAPAVEQLRPNLPFVRVAT